MFILDSEDGDWIFLHSPMGDVVLSNPGPERLLLAIGLHLLTSLLVNKTWLPVLRVVHSQTVK